MCYPFFNYQFSIIHYPLKKRLVFLNFPGLFATFAERKTENPMSSIQDTRTPEESKNHRERTDDTPNQSPCPHDTCSMKSLINENE